MNVAVLLCETKSVSTGAGGWAATVVVVVEPVVLVVVLVVLDVGGMEVVVAIVEAIVVGRVLCSVDVARLEDEASEDALELDSELALLAMLLDTDELANTAIDTETDTEDEELELDDELLTGWEVVVVLGAVVRIVEVARL